MAYKLRQSEIEPHLKCKLKEVCRGFCLEVWTKALNVAKVDSFFELRDPRNVIFPPTLKGMASSSALGVYFTAPTFQA